MQSKIVSAIALTGLCLAAFRIYPIVGGVAFALGVIYLMFQSARDRAAYDRIRGVNRVTPAPLTVHQRWSVLCVMDAFVRDLRFPPATEEQRIVHIMGLGFLSISVIGAILLFITRPQKKS